MENLLSAAICGTTYHLFAGQPLTVIGSTGPVLVFETIVFDMCKRFGLEYLSLRFWIHAWMTTFLLIVVSTNVFTQHSLHENECTDKTIIS